MYGQHSTGLTAPADSNRVETLQEQSEPGDSGHRNEGFVQNSVELVDADRDQSSETENRIDNNHADVIEKPPTNGVVYM